MNYKFKMKFNNLRIFFKKVCLVTLILLGVMLITKDLNLFKVKANETLEINSETITLGSLQDVNPTFESTSFTLTFDGVDQVSSPSGKTGVELSENISFELKSKNDTYHIVKIEFSGYYNNQEIEDPNLLEVIYAPKAIVSYSQTTYDMNSYQTITESENSIAEYPNTVQTASFKTINSCVITSVKIYYQTKIPITYTILDLNKGSISFSGSVFSAKGIKNEVYTETNFDENTKFYIVQTITENDNIVKYNSYINNNYIVFGDNYITTVDMVLDDIWCSYSTSSQGGIHVPVSSDTYKKNVTIRLKGTNKFSRISYWTSKGTASSLTFTSFYGDGSQDGKLIVIGKQVQKDNSVHGTLSQNGWNSVIGGNDSAERVIGLNFKGGTVIAVSTAKDQCTAIGAGGNGYAEIKISGGKVIAISYTTGTAIGGGIGHLASGGESSVTISGGEVYAYNMGQPYRYTCNSETARDYNFVPGTAIGAGSSYESSGATGTVSITGGKVYAYSNGGSGLGGGNSIKSTGGQANVSISGGYVTSYGYIPQEEETRIVTIINNLKEQVLNVVPSGQASILSDDIINPFDYGSSGSGIGGGSGERGNGGSATITISGGTLDASSIGGGNSVHGKGASATVTVSGGSIKCDTIGGGFSENNGYENGYVYVSGGSLNATMSAIPQISKTNSDLIYLTRVSILDLEDKKLTNTLINQLSFKNGYSYGSNEMRTDEDAMLYLWLPSDANLIGCKVENKSLLFEPHEESDGMISAYEIGILKETQNNKYNYYVNTVTSEFYTLYNSYNDGILSNELKNTTIVPNNTYFTIYADIKEGYNANIYYAVELSNGNRVFQQASTTSPSASIISVGLTITQNTTILFEVYSTTTDEHYFIMDLYNGNINVIEEEGQIIVEQNDYKFTLANGGIYVSSGGIVTPNTISIDIKQNSNGDNNEIDLFVNNIIISSDKPAIDIKTGTVYLQTGSSNDIINSQTTAIHVEENAKLIIDVDGEDALKLSSSDSTISPISGKGTLVFNNNDGYFSILTSNNVPAISVGIYECSGSNKYEAALHVGQYEFELIGYIQGKKLYDATYDMSNNTDNFSARGVYKVLNGVTASKYGDTNVNTDGNYVIKLAAIELDAIVGSITLTQNGNELSLKTHYELETVDDGKSYMLTIYGWAFETGNIMIFAASENLIAYQIINYTGVYDTFAHSITVAISNPDLFKVEYMIDGTGEYTTTNPTFIDVTNSSGVKIWVKITPKDSSSKYNPVENVYGIVKITPATNEFLNSLTCIDVAYKEDGPITPNPSIKAKWGTVEYRYFTDSDCTNQVTSFGIGTYYVKAYVAAGIGSNGNTNYYAIETNYVVRFKVVEVHIYTSTSRNLSKISGTQSTITVPLNGEFSVLFQVGATDNMAIKVENSELTENNPALPVGTKITFIDFATNNSGVNKYYYYIVNQDDIQGTTVTIELTKFIKMGTRNTKYETIKNVNVNYQFCVEFPENRPNCGQIAFSLQGSSDNDDKTIYIASTVNSVEQVQCTGSSVNDNKVTYNISVNADGASKKNQILVVDLNSNIINGLTIKLKHNSSEIELLHSTGSVLFYKLSSYANLDTDYTLEIENNTEDVVNIESVRFDVRSTDYEVPYVLENRSLDNSQISLQKISLINIPKVEFMVNIPDEHLVIDNETIINFTVSTNEQNFDQSKLFVKIYRKVSGIYVSLSDNMSINIQNNAIDISNFYLQNGTYKLEFIYKDVKYEKVIIVHR